MVSPTKTMSFYDELLLIKAAQNGNMDSENMLFHYHKSSLEKSLQKYKFLKLIIDDLPSYIEPTYRVAIHKYNVESNVKFIHFASWFIKNTLERAALEQKTTCV